MKTSPEVFLRGLFCLNPSGRRLTGTQGRDQRCGNYKRLNVTGYAAPLRLVRVIGPGAEPGGAPLSFTEIILESRQGGSVWMRDVLAVYAAAAGHNSVLCGSLVLLAGDLPPETCRR